MPGMRATMHEFKAGKLHSGSKGGPVVKSRKQAIAIGMSEAGKGGSPKSPAEHMAKRRSQGMTFRAMADEHGVSKSTAHRNVMRQGYVPMGSAKT